jgi:hypothetical protein
MKRLLKEYLVTVYNQDNTRRWAYTLYGKTYQEVSDKVETRLNGDEGYVTLDYKGKSLLEDWSDEY